MTWFFIFIFIFYFFGDPSPHFSFFNLGLFSVAISKCSRIFNVSWSWLPNAKKKNLILKNFSESENLILMWYLEWLILMIEPILALTGNKSKIGRKTLAIFEGLWWGKVGVEWGRCGRNSVCGGWGGVGRGVMCQCVFECYSTLRVLAVCVLGFYDVRERCFLWIPTKRNCENGI